MLLVVMNVGIHLCIIVPILRKNGSGLTTGLLNLRYYSELRRYKEICLRDNMPLTWHTASIQIQKLLFAMLIGWFLLLFLKLGADSVKTVP